MSNGFEPTQTSEKRVFFKEAKVQPVSMVIIIIIRQPLCPVVGRRHQHVLCCPLPYRADPVFVQVVSPPLGWSPLSSFLVTWSPSGDMRGPSVVG